MVESYETQNILEIRLFIYWYLFAFIINMLKTVVE